MSILSIELVRLSSSANIMIVYAKKQIKVPEANLIKCSAQKSK